jgi:DNA-binding transcriptional ArsR family regulator
MQMTSTGARQNKRAARSRAEWLQEVTQWRSSGQRAGEYARAHGLHASTLTYWASRLRDEVGVKSTVRSRKTAKAFVSVRVSDKARKEMAPVGEGVDAFEVWLTNGRRVRVSAGFDVNALSRLLAVAEGGAAC